LKALATSGEYDVVVIDCPPGGHAVQTSVLGAARWLLVPAKTDQASLSGLGEIARRFGAARVTNPQLQLLGVFLFDVGVTSRKVLREARAALSAALAGLPPETVLDVAIRHVEASAQAARAYGRLAHELEEEEAAAAPRWNERRDGDDAVVIPKSASGLAGDYYALARAVLERIAVLSGTTTSAAPNTTATGPTGTVSS
jgi:cellulose biosynthesis protein BcsQ